jgi:hypothetical protein
MYRHEAPKSDQRQDFNQVNDERLDDHDIKMAQDSVRQAAAGWKRCAVCSGDYYVR